MSEGTKKIRLGINHLMQRHINNAVDMYDIPQDVFLIELISLGLVDFKELVSKNDISRVLGHFHHATRSFPSDIVRKRELFIPLSLYNEIVDSLMTVDITADEFVFDLLCYSLNLE